MSITKNNWTKKNSDKTKPNSAGISRRRLLGYGAAGAGGFAAASSRNFTAFARPDAPGTGDTLVVIFLRGGADFLSLVPPYGEGEYYNARPTLAIPQPGQNNGALPLNDFFGFHPSLSGLYNTAWADGNLAVVHATGFPAEVTTNRSHFEMQNYAERSTTSSSVTSGWLARLLAGGMGGTIPGTALSGNLPTALSGSLGAVAINNPSFFDIGGFDRNQRDTIRTALSDMYRPEAGLTGAIGSRTLSAVTAVNAAAPGDLAPRNGASYPDHYLGRRMRQVAQMVKGGLGVQVAAMDLGGWDLHDNIGPRGVGNMADKTAILGDSLAAFYTDLGTDNAEVTTVVMTEFGRTTKQNDNDQPGVDHGRAAGMFIMGSNVVGNSGTNGGVYADWPGLAERSNEKDLFVTTDFRTVLHEIVTKRVEHPDPDYVLNGFSPSAGHIGIAN